MTLLGTARLAQKPTGACKDPEHPRGLTTAPFGVIIMT